MRSRRKLYQKLAAIFGDCCYYCGREFTRTGKRQRTLDHLTPRSRGGTNRFGNLVLACFGCNHLKGDMTYTEFVCSDGYRVRRSSANEERNRPPKRRIEVLTRLDTPIMTGALHG